MIKKLFTNWKKPYAFFWVFLLCFSGFILFVEEWRRTIDASTFVVLAMIIGLYHLVFMIVMQGIENDERRVIENHTLTLQEFSNEYEVTPETALQLLKEGKLEGVIAFKTYPLRNNSKEDIQNLVVKEPV